MSISKGTLISGVNNVTVLQEDIDAMCDDELINPCICIMVLRWGDLSASRGVNFVDPSWLSEWERLGFHEPTTTPSFLVPEAGVQLQGLAVPFNEGNNHWTTFHVLLNRNGTIYFNSLRDDQREIRCARAENVMSNFFIVFREHFRGSGEFEFQEDVDGPDQGDVVSCGLYVISNIIDLLGVEKPRGTRLQDWQIRQFREQGVAWSTEVKRSEGISTSPAI